MSWLSYHFKCVNGHLYEDIVQGCEGAPDECPTCHAAGETAERQMPAPKLHTACIPMYPGNKRQMAAYGAQERRPAAKAGRQISVPRAARRAAS